ncbi:MAG TPA: hypothetical protein VGN60_07725 [Devosia sp.]|nr:hypothetical protein [Devosia sp.]
MISKDTATDIALTYREIEVGEKLLEEIVETMSRREVPDVRDAFGRRRHGLELGIPTSDNAKRMFDVPWNLAKPIIEAHIASKKAMLSALTEKARGEIEAA